MVTNPNPLTCLWLLPFLTPFHSLFLTK
ncbi:hypothetical protein Anas_05954 [Armadillidium nasatum]|uniref:Uncharacterized protein n=1 Tax=Armadillidium nasatum TaxID=96803 RepID=A0A5N5TDN4_9CRUS|nr:hypothetical protein Anas_05954 [Armadillidium nasatum]